LDHGIIGINPSNYKSDITNSNYAMNIIHILIYKKDVMNSYLKGGVNTFMTVANQP